MENFSSNVRQLRGMGKGRKKVESIPCLFSHMGSTSFTQANIAPLFFEAQKCNYAYPHTALRKAELTL